MSPHLVCVGGEDHNLRIPFLLALREKGFRVSAISNAAGAAFSKSGIPHDRLEFDRFGSGGGDWKSLRGIRGLVSELRPDIVQTFDTKPNLLAPLALRGLAPVVRTINGLGWTFSSREPRALALRPIFCGLHWLASLWTAATVFQNKDDQAFFQRFRLIAADKGRLIRSSGIDIDAFVTAMQRVPPAAMRHELGLRSAEIVIFVGRLTRQKGIETLLQAVPRIASERPNVRVVLVGPRESEGPFAVKKADIERYAPFVIQLGPRRDVPGLLGLSDVFVFPTQYREGIPRVLLEAGLAGLPIVASQMPGCNDVVEDGWNGYLVAPGNAEALSSRVLDLLCDRARGKVMGSRSIGLVRDRFALSGIVDQYCDLYESILRDRFRGGSSRSTSTVPVTAKVRLDEARQ